MQLQHQKPPKKRRRRIPRQSWRRKLKKKQAADAKVAAEKEADVISVGPDDEEEEEYRALFLSLAPQANFQSQGRRTGGVCKHICYPLYHKLTFSHREEEAEYVNQFAISYITS
jgi:hypothetical protein